MKKILTQIGIMAIGVTLSFLVTILMDFVEVNEETFGGLLRMMLLSSAVLWFTIGAIIVAIKYKGDE